MFALSRVLGLSAERVVLGWRRRIMARVTRVPAAHLDEHAIGRARLAHHGRRRRDAEPRRLGARALDEQHPHGARRARRAAPHRLANDAACALAFAALPGLGLDFAHRKMRPLFRERGRLRAEVAGRLTQTSPGMRVVKAYGAERREQLVFTQGPASPLPRDVADDEAARSVMNALAVVASARVIAIVVVLGGRAILDGRMTLGDFGSYVAFALMFAAPARSISRGSRRA